MMDAREVANRVKALQGSIGKSEPADIMSQIETLKKEVAPTEEMLRTTKAGLLMGKLRQNANKDIARAATEVVVKWKKCVEQEKAAKKGKASASPVPKPASPAPKPAGTKKKFEGDPEKRKFQDDGVDIKRTGSSVRDNCVGLIYNGLAYRSTESVDSVLQRAIEVEHAAFKHFNGEGKEYKEKIRSLFQNLKVKSNSDLGKGVMSGEIIADKFVRMSSQELMSAEMRKQNALLEEENMKKAQIPIAEKSMSESLECGKCKKRMVAYSQAQTRSADEPMTTFCECMNCRHRWKIRQFPNSSGMISIMSNRG
ncbi:transcription factor S-II- central domain-containing protein [Apiospora marii]|uniref:Transcription factor S-II- central domain-containing protein n=1 Tax=Apiospora marii TaxID=335849 RepID=A0ABR1REC1_9PEZI